MFLLSPPPESLFSLLPPFEVPPNLTVPQEKSPLVTREGDTVELQCQVTGKPKPIILWSRADKEFPMPDGAMQMESYDGILRIVNVSREMTGTYRCQTSQYNGFNVKPRDALVQLIVQCESMLCFFLVPFLPFKSLQLPFCAKLCSLTGGSRILWLLRRDLDPCFQPPEGVFVAAQMT